MADRRARWARFGQPAALALVIGAMVAVMYATHRPGHWWGDDWALYIRQAEGLLDGHPNRVLIENRFTVERSAGPEFSPPLYPWGFPLILAPFVAVVGRDLDRLTIVPVLSAVVFGCCWWALARRRIGTWPALAGILALGLSPLLLSWSELIQSEWPFLASVGVALVVLDRAVRDDALLDRRRLWRLCLVGLTAAAAFSVRREGLAMVAAIGAAQLGALIAGGTAPWRLRGRPLADAAATLATPYIAFVAAVGLLQVTLPSTVVPRYDGTSIANVWTLRGRLVRNIAQIIGLQRPWQPDPRVLGSEGLGWVVLAVVLVLAAGGAALVLAGRRRGDAHLVAYALAAFLIGGSFRSPINRYMASVAPVVLLLAAATAHAAIRRAWREGAATIAVAAGLLAIVCGNLANANLRADEAAAAERAGAVTMGAEHPAAVEMFAMVEALTEPGDIVAAHKARAMVLETGRMAIQVDEFRPIPDDVELAVVVTERRRPVAAELAAPGSGYREVWRNTWFVIFQPAPRG